MTTLSLFDGKVCSTCGYWRPFYMFYKRQKGILYGHCKGCHNAMNNANYARNRDKVLERQKTYYRAHPGLNAERLARYRKKHPEKSRAAYKRQQARRRADPVKRQKVLALARRATRAWIKARPGKVIEYSSRRRARKSSAPGRFTAQDVHNKYQQQNGRCYYCGCALGVKYEVDHFIPLAKGGSNDVQNIVIACVSCNRSKSDKLPHEWPGYKPETG